MPSSVVEGSKMSGLRLDPQAIEWWIKPRGEGEAWSCQHLIEGRKRGTP
jgi:hypothetical protein